MVSIMGDIKYLEYARRQTGGPETGRQVVKETNAFQNCIIASVISPTAGEMICALNTNPRKSRNF